MRAIIEPERATMAGHIRFHTRPDPEYLREYARDAVEFGYTVFTPYRRRGYATEAARAVMQWAQASFGVRHFVASVAPGNAPSLGVVARLGFSRVGTQIDEIDGEEHVFLRTVAP
jgi:RimJ/RimL family protein N-acetyltransferase